MKNLRALLDDWPSLLDRLTGGIDLEKTLRDLGGLKRRRRIGDAQTLLRLALIYCLCRWSLRSTAAWAQAQELAHLSDVALLKRLRKAAPWFEFLLGSKLAERVEGLKALPGARRLRLVDATTSSVLGSQGTDYRIHVGFDLRTQQMDHIEITGPEGGETLARHSFNPGDLVLGDRGYAHRRGLSAVVEAKADFLVRINWQNLPLEDDQHHKVDLAQLLKRLQKQVPGQDLVDLDVWTAADPKHGLGPIAARLIVARKTEETPEAERQKIQHEAGRKGRKADPRSLVAAEFVLLLTSVSRQEISAQQVLDLYRLRWQIEMVFKRSKGHLRLDDLPCKDPDLVKSCLCVKLLAGLMLEDLTTDFLAFSPCGAPGSEQAPEPLENPADPAWGDDLLDSGVAPSVRALGQSLALASPRPG